MHGRGLAAAGVLAVVALTCPDDAVPAEVVPSAVVAARMCDTHNGVASWFAPQDGLHADLAPLMAVLADAARVPATSGSGDRYFCTDDGGYGFDLRLALASGGLARGSRPSRGRPDPRPGHQAAGLH